MKMYLWFLGLVLTVKSASSQPPPHFYDGVQGLKGQELLEELHGLTDDHVVMDYYALYSCFRSTDRRPDGTVWDLYSDIPGQDPPYVYYFTSSDECGAFQGEGDCFDREHTWPKSWFGGQVYPMFSDLFIVYPADGYVNSRRLNFPYGETADPAEVFLGGSRLGFSCTPGYGGFIFEPADGYKGDLARTYFYVCARYYGEDQGWPGSAMTCGSQLEPWALRMMLTWNAEDPVSQKETDRNEAVWGIQHNRNPFIDHPEYAGLVWGDVASTGQGRQGSHQLIITEGRADGTYRFRLPVENRAKLVSLQVMMLTGVIIRPEYTGDGPVVSFRMAGLPAGLYLLRVETEEGVCTGKIIKKRPG